MKVIPLSEAKARLSHYSRLCHSEPVIVTVKGVPAFQLAPLEEDDDLIDRLLEFNPKFQDYLKNCLRSRNVSSAEALRRLK
ncbi:MAG TPA: type II toxin-antitoxin system prevent-host-death family antitoxin [Pirellulales bacterium]|jgi:prevent-host-death family protein|nr:type II toxin-antitoxin system prevent-host-death family antitoxin [Pirellulales bacterium]